MNTTGTRQQRNFQHSASVGEVSEVSDPLLHLFYLFPLYHPQSQEKESYRTKEKITYFTDYTDRGRHCWCVELLPLTTQFFSWRRL